MIAGLAELGTAAGIFEIAKATAEQGDEAEKTSKKVGLSVEAFQELTYAAKLNKVSTEEMTQALRHLSLNTYKASTGSKEARDQFHKLGLSSDDLAKMPTDQILGKVADKFAVMPDGIKKTAMATQLFGRAGSSLLPMLNQGSKGINALKKEADSLGIVLSSEDAEAGEEFIDNLERAKAALTGLRNIVGMALLPVMNEMIVTFKDFVVANRGDITKTINSGMVILVAHMKDLWALGKRVWNMGKDVVRMLGGLENTLKLLTRTATLFFAVKGLMTMGSWAIGVFSFARGLTALALGLKTAGNAASIAQMKMVAVPLAIGAAIAAVFLMAEDITAFFQGRKSVTGELIKAFDKFADYMNEHFAAEMKYAADLILAPFKFIQDEINEVLDKIKKLEAEFPILAKARKAVFGDSELTAGANAFGPGPTAKERQNHALMTGNAAEIKREFPKGLPGGATPNNLPLNFAPGALDKTGGKAPPTVNTTNNNNFHIDAGGHDPKTAEKIVTKGVKAAQDKTHRDTLKDLTPAVAE